MESNKIEDSEILHRVVRKSDPDGFIDGKPTGSLFVDLEGTSVDRDGGRDVIQISVLALYCIIYYDSVSLNL